MRSLVVIAAIASLAAGCAAAPPAPEVPVQPAGDARLAAAPRRAAAEIDVQFEFFEASRELIARDGIGRFDPVSPACQTAFAARVVAPTAADVRSAYATRRLDAPRIRLVSGQSGFASALEQHAYIADILVTEKGAEPEIGLFTTGMTVSATAIAREGSVSLEAVIEAAWLVEPLGATKVHVETPEFVGDLEVPEMFRERFPVRFDLAPGDTGLVAIDRGRSGAPLLALVRATAR